MGRLVVTHSSYIEGLIPVLKKIANYNRIKTITPGRIGRSRGKSIGLKLKVTTKIIGGYKIIARKGKSVQEVFIITTISKDELRIILKDII